MSIQNHEAVMEYTPFVLPAVMPGESFSNEEFEDMEGLQMSFQRVKIPGGGVLQFEMPGDDPDNPDYERTLEGVVLYNHSSNAFWPEGSEYDDNTPPLCQSVDGKLGYGKPGGICETCPNNRFGSDPKGTNGKACKNMRVLYLLRSGDYMPIQLSLPPTSIRPFSDFVSAIFMTRQRPIYSSLIQISLKRAESNGFVYSVASFKKVRDFTGEELAQIGAYAKSFREQAKVMLSQRADQAEAGIEGGVEVQYSGSPMSLPDNQDHFAVGIVDAERDVLP